MLLSTVRAECNYKIGIECEIGKKSSEMVQRSLNSVAFHGTMKHYRAVGGSCLIKGRYETRVARSAPSRILCGIAPSVDTFSTYLVAVQVWYT